MAAALSGELPPGPRLPAAAQVLCWCLRPAEFLEACQRRYGDLFTLRLAAAPSSPPFVFVADPALATKLLRDPERAPVGSARDAIAPMFGPDSILLADGEAHQRLRRLLSAPVGGAQIDRHAEAIAAAADRRIDAWPLQRPFSLRPSMQELTLEVILETVFGLHGQRRRAEIGERVERLLALVANPAGSFAMALPPRIGPLDLSAALRRRRRQTDEVLFAEIRRRRQQSPSGGDDVLGWLLDGPERGEPSLGDGEVRDHLVTLLLAGHETTATALAWTLEHLLRSPRALRRAREDAADPGGGEYLDAVAKESLRLTPPLPIVQRTLVEPLAAGDFALPAGMPIVACSYLIQRRPDLYPQPHEFRPERFLGPSPPPGAWLPFGGGARHCLGAGFARRQMQIVLRQVLKRAQLRPATRRAAGVRRRAIVIAPARGGRVVLTARAPA